MSIPQKSLAQFLHPAQARFAMNTAPHSLNRGHAFTAVFISAAFLWTLALSVSPQLHERIHRDANRIEHTCAVTFVTSGTYDYSAPPAIVPATAASVFAPVADLNSIWVSSPFLRASIFEHAPPANS